MSTPSTEIIKNKAKVHTVYKRADGKRVPSATTILGVINKRGLVHAAWELGVQGIDHEAYWSELAEIGTLTHAMIYAHIKGNKPEDIMAEHSPSIQDKAQNCFISYLEWERGHKIEPILMETPLVSEDFSFGGTPDFFGYIDGALTLMDFKTGKGVWPEHFYQLAAYRQLLEENGYLFGENDTGILRLNLNRFLILNVQRSESEAYYEKLKTDVSACWMVFLDALNLYKDMQKAEK